MKSGRYFMLPLIVVWAVTACFDSTNFKKFVFPVDSTLATKVLAVEGLSLRVPDDWEVDTSSRAAVVMAEDSMGTTPAQERTELAQLDSGLGATMKVGSFDWKLKQANDFPNWVQQRVHQEREACPGAAISENWLRLQDVRVVQLVIADSQNVRFKIFAEGTAPVLIEYALDQDFLQQSVKFVETSLGSLRRSATVPGARG